MCLKLNSVINFFLTMNHVKAPAASQFVCTSLDYVLQSYVCTRVHDNDVIAKTFVTDSFLESDLDFSIEIMQANFP